eukprot:GEMP01078579.1.p1 GENE.GEMP01078579.1~~GEMP01078579.1.p1  ORF type:complete len:131 (+),score=0.54 GEMP01078579.1:398-790(+)
MCSIFPPPSVQPPTKTMGILFIVVSAYQKNTIYVVTFFVLVFFVAQSDEHGRTSSEIIIFCHFSHSLLCGHGVDEQTVCERRPGGGRKSLTPFVSLSSPCALLRTMCQVFLRVVFAGTFFVVIPPNGDRI